MAQPTPYTRTFSFTNWSTNHPSDQQPGVSLDDEFEDIELTTGQILTNLALIQRDDGALANQSVGPDQIDPALTIGLRTIGDWAATHAYVVNDAVWYQYKLYRCLTLHTSGASFATDLAAAKWVLIFDLMPYVLAALQTGAIEVSVDTAAINAALLLKAEYATSTPFTAKQIIQINTGTTLADYQEWKPTNYGAGIPALKVRKSATAKKWELVVEDGAGGTGMLLNFVADGGVTLNGVAPYSSANPPPSTDTAAIRHARRLACAF